MEYEKQGRSLLWYFMFLDTKTIHKVFKDISIIHVNCRNYVKYDNKSIIISMSTFLSVDALKIYMYIRHRENILI